ncbi:DUF4846 domain-containing protein [Pseudotenacibaculum sp. MALMAid0570]|uniref:DUF4846 domain-containing protein n=1 Tax=Pseudotenacibaculum sp. MALMAid0570 TaxID=3143938 RepID=UPI0032E03E38
MKKKLLFLSVILVAIIVISQVKEVRPTVTAIKTVFVQPNLINKKGDSVSARVKTPKGFSKVYYPKGSFQEFIQSYPLKSYGSKVINYDGSEYFYQSGHVGVLDLSVPKNGLQQCADALIRLRAEYLWKTNQQSKIGFEFTSGHYCSWKKYAEGYRPKIKGNKVSFHQTSTKDFSKSNFYRYLNLIYMYSGTLSLYNESPKVTSSKKLQVGDMLVYPGTPGHIVMIVDEVKSENGEKRFILAQGNTPAQSVHMLKNPNDPKFNPWYKLELNSYIEVPGYYFNKSKFIRFKD